MEQCRILIADDHPIFRDGLRVLLETAPDLTVIGEATTGDEAIARATELRPDVILMDLKMPGCNGIEATQQILADDLHVNIAVMTSLMTMTQSSPLCEPEHAAISSRALARRRRCGRSARSRMVRRSLDRGSPVGSWPTSAVCVQDSPVIRPRSPFLS